MDRHVAFLRGMNLGGRRITNAELRMHFEALGCEEVAFLAEEPVASSVEEALTHATDEDRLAIEGRELYWLPDGGLSESDLDLEALAAVLGPTTIRTKGTVEQIAAKFLG